MAAIAAGILNTVQTGANTVHTGANASLNTVLDKPILVTLIVAVTYAVIYLRAAPFRRLGWPGSERIAAGPW
ncbi:hypothetical protein [Methylobacterium sp. PvR107]|uniref:hypothetical protein n=1 Tax=Methylobacterium sp. PvR107 TaxID=2806597 RepID=UPI001B6B40E5|nr:hypothetical protein [Methylobacterium sp. PvR107]MBP1182977.1 hypothetical protein [Methylobacterium sp. PvR107]